MILNLMAATALAASPAEGGERCTNALERTTVTMGTTLRIAACAAERDAAHAAIDAAFREVRRLEGVLSSWTTASQIGRINAAGAHAEVHVTRELAALLAEAGDWVRATAGAFDPAIGALIDGWDLRGAGRVPSETALVAARAASGWQHMALTDAAVRRGPAGWWLDTGGFGKGAALRSAADKLRAHGVSAATLDFGGQLLVFGEAAEVSVADPRVRERAIGRLMLADVSVATTSQSERYIEADGVRYGHVLDPRTGRPVAPWGSVTVVAADALAADALSTALFVMGADSALIWAADRNDIGVLVLEVSAGVLDARMNRAMKQWIEEIDFNAEPNDRRAGGGFDDSRGGAGGGAAAGFDAGGAEAAGGRTDARNRGTASRR